MGFDCAGIRAPKYILELPNGGTLIVKEHFDESVNLDRCLSASGGFGADASCNALTPTTEDKSLNQPVVRQDIKVKDGRYNYLYF